VAEIRAEQVRELREQTGAGMMDCKKVLVEARGDLSRALELLRERGLLKARGKLGRTTSEGRVAASVSPDGHRAALLEVNCETDFVARTPDYQGLAQELADLARDRTPADVGALLELPLGGRTAGERLVEAVAKLGENMQVRRVRCLEAGPRGRVESYVHAGGKIGALVEVESDAPPPEVAALGRNLCMHVTASSPLGISRADLPAALVERERAVLTLQAEQEGKPPAVTQKMVEGRLNRFFREVVLLEQPLVMDPDQSVETALKPARARIVAFVRFQLGEELSA
jgi:elongation factor Ts